MKFEQLCGRCKTPGRKVVETRKVDGRKASVCAICAAELDFPIIGHRRARIRMAQRTYRLAHVEEPRGG
jgi:hypothetical protein